MLAKGLIWWPKKEKPVMKHSLSTIAKLVRRVINVIVGKY